MSRNPDSRLADPAVFHRAVLARLNRRGFLVASAAAALGALGGPAIRPARAADPVLPTVAPIPGSMKGTGSLRVASAGGALSAAERKAIFEPFQAMTGIKIVETEGFSSAQIKSQVDSKSVQWDAVALDYSNIAELQRHGQYFEPVDYDVVKTDGIPKDQTHEFGLGYLLIGTVMTYRTDAFGGKAPQGYVDFWDLSQFPGPRNWMSGSMGIAPFLEGALIADGVAMDKLYPLDIPRAFASLTKIHKSIVKFWDSGAQSAQLMANNETVMGVAWNGRIAPLEEQGAPVRIQWNGAMLSTDNYAVLKGAENRANAMKFLAFLALPEVQARLSMLITYGFTNAHAAEFVPPERLKLLPSAYLDRSFFSDGLWWIDNKQKAIDAWTEWSLT